MATKRDLVEAHAFNRRRLVTAFLSGAPGGREVEPVRYGRTIVGGVVLAGLLVAGAAVSGVLRPAVGDDWREDGLVIGRESGSRFVMSEGRMYPVINSASARLLLARDGELKISYVPDDVLVDEPKLQTVGISGAPDYLPPPDLLVQSGWTACTNTSGGLQTTVQSTPVASESEEDALVARSTDDDSLWLIVSDRRFPWSDDTTGQSVLRGLGITGDDPFPASQTWLDLIPTGTELAPIAVPGAGDRTPTGVDGLDVVGTPIDVDGSGYVLGEDGLISLSPFAYSVYAATSEVPEVELTAGQLQSLPSQSADLAPQDWPSAVPTQYTGSTPCLILAEGETSTQTSRAVLAQPNSSEDAASGSEVDVDVAQGRGALVRSTARATTEDGDTEFLIDARGSRFALGPKEFIEDTRMRLGYESITPMPIPRAWAELFASGPVLTPDAAAQEVVAP